MSVGVVSVALGKPKLNDVDSLVVVDDDEDVVVLSGTTDAKLKAGIAGVPLLSSFVFVTFAKLNDNGFFISFSSFSSTSSSESFALIPLFFFPFGFWSSATKVCYPRGKFIEISVPLGIAAKLKEIGESSFLSFDVVEKIFVVVVVELPLNKFVVVVVDLLVSKSGTTKLFFFSGSYIYFKTIILQILNLV